MTNEKTSSETFRIYKYGYQKTFLPKAISDQVTKKLRTFTVQRNPNGAVHGCYYKESKLKGQIENLRNPFRRGCELSFVAEGKSNGMYYKQRAYYFQFETEQEARNFASMLPTFANGCGICHAKESNAACVPCGHLKMCFECASQAKEQNGVCPCCKSSIQDIIKIFT